MGQIVLFLAIAALLRFFTTRENCPDGTFIRSENLTSMVCLMVATFLNVVTTASPILAQLIIPVSQTRTVEIVIATRCGSPPCPVLSDNRTASDFGPFEELIVVSTSHARQMSTIADNSLSAWGRVLMNQRFPESSHGISSYLVDFQLDSEATFILTGELSVGPNGDSRVSLAGISSGLVFEEVIVAVARNETRQVTASGVLEPGSYTFIASASEPNLTNGVAFFFVELFLESTELEDSDNDGVPDHLDNCPVDFNPVEGCMGDADCLGPVNLCDSDGGGLCAQQNDNDGDGNGDVCDSDDDNDGIGDVIDNCPINANPDQADDDFDDLGNACDTSFDNGSVAEYVEGEATFAVQVITSASPPGGNGMISKLIGNGGIATRISNAVSSFAADLIGLDTYLSELAAAHNKLDGLDNQLSAKIGNGQIVDPESSQLLNVSTEIRTAINNLIANAEN